jgi:hypothetical protein
MVDADGQARALRDGALFHFWALHGSFIWRSMPKTWGKMCLMEKWDVDIFAI